MSASAGSLPRYIFQRLAPRHPDALDPDDAGVLRPAGGARRPGLGGPRRPALARGARRAQREALGLNEPADRAVLGLPGVDRPPRLRHHLHRQPADPARGPRQRRRDAVADHGGVHLRAGRSASRSACSPAAARHRHRRRASDCSAILTYAAPVFFIGLLAQLYVARPLGLPTSWRRHARRRSSSCPSARTSC